MEAAEAKKQIERDKKKAAEDAKKGKKWDIWHQIHFGAYSQITFYNHIETKL